MPEDRASRHADLTEIRARSTALFTELTGADVPASRRGQIRDDLVRLHLPLVEHLTRRFLNRGEPYDDLVQVGTIGLIKAIDRFDLDRGVENLLLPPVVDERAWSMDQVYEAFPVLADRRRQTGTHLSGGEQQMLSIARVLRTGARMLLADEPTEGLSPLLVQQIGDIFRSVREHGITVLLIEQNLHFASSLADRHHLIARGQVVESLDNSEVKEREHELLEYLGI